MHPEYCRSCGNRKQKIRPYNTSLISAPLASRLPELLLHTYKPKRDLRSTSEGLLIEPSMPRYRLNTYGGRSFHSMTPRLWTSLPVDLQNIEAVTCFKSELKTHLLGKHIKHWNAELYYPDFQYNCSVDNALSFTSFTFFYVFLSSR